MNEEERLAERARRIWGDNLFSPEAMAEDWALNSEEAKTGRVQKRLNRMKRLSEENEA